MIKTSRWSPDDDDHNCGWKAYAKAQDAKLAAVMARLENLERRAAGHKSEKRKSSKLPPADAYHEERALLRRAIEALSPERARVIGLLMEGATETQIAAALGVTVYSAGLLVDDARAALTRAVRPRVREHVAAPVPVATARVDLQRLEHNGRTLTMAQWARETGIKYETLRSRLANGWDIARALDPDAKRSVGIEYRGETKTVAEWARAYGLNYCTFRDRLIKRGWPMEDALHGRATDAAAE